MFGNKWQRFLYYCCCCRRRAEVEEPAIIEEDAAEAALGTADIAAYFSYKNITAQTYRTYGGYNTAAMEPPYIAFCRDFSENTIENAVGWKLYIRIQETNENILRAWDCLAPILIAHQINTIKFVAPHLIGKKRNGKPIVIYMSSNPNKTFEEWYNFLLIVTEELNRNNIIETRMEPVATRSINRFISYRNDRNNMEYREGMHAKELYIPAKEAVRKAGALHVSAHNPYGYPDPIGSLQAPQLEILQEAAGAKETVAGTGTGLMSLFNVQSASR